MKDWLRALNSKILKKEPSTEMVERGGNIEEDVEKPLYEESILNIKLPDNTTIDINATVNQNLSIKSGEIKITKKF